MAAGAHIDRTGKIAQLRFTAFGGLPLVADSYGDADAPAVLMLHGGGQTRRSWRAAAKALSAAGRHVIAVDLRGHGDSGWATDGRYDLEAYAEDIRAILKQLSTRPVIVGASIGGLSALAALEGPGEALASGLVLVDAAPWLNKEAGARMGAILRRHAKGFATPAEAARAANELSHRGGDVETLKAHLRQDASGRYYWRWDPRFLDGFDISDNTRMERAAQNLKLPTLVMHGVQSEVITDDAIARFRALMPDAEFAEIEGAGHLVASERLDAFNAALLEFLERRLPRASIDFEEGSDPRILRDALGCFGTGVIIATTLDSESKPVGLTVNSFTSVSLDPPLILFCIDNKASSLPAFEHAKAFAVNVLHIGQQPASTRFAKRGELRFEVTATEVWETGVPIISSSLASFECERHARHDAGDHAIFIGRVKRARFEPRRDPLLFFRGKYRRLHFD